MLVPLFFAASIKAVFSSPVISPQLLDSTSLIVIGRSIAEQCANSTNNRSLYDILRSCAATTFACTWISMHKNVPSAGRSKGRLLFERILLLDYAVVAPECVTIWAFRQHLAASRHVKEYNDKFGLKYEPQSFIQSVRNWLFSTEQDCSIQPWTLTHGFLLEMRGLVILRDGEPPRVVESVAQLPGPIDISLDQILDKSKRDSLAKLLVIFQTVYFVVQCIARWAAHLDVTEIETLTLAFAFMNVLTYWFWWHKPQDMNYPIEIDLRSPASRISHATNKHGDSIPNLPSDSESDKLKCTPTTPKFAPSSSPSKRPWWMSILMLPVSAFRLFRLHFIYPFYVMCESKTGFENTFTGQLFYTSGEGLSEADAPKHWVSLGLIVIIFGGVHFIPVWLSYFPTQAERWIWLGCAAWMAGHPLIVLLEKVLSLFSWGPKYVVDGHRRAFPPSVKYGFPTYGAARICILLLALLALRQLPCTALENVEWSTFIPHV